MTACRLSRTYRKSMNAENAGSGWAAATGGSLVVVTCTGRGPRCGCCGSCVVVGERRFSHAVVAEEMGVRRKSKRCIGCWWVQGMADGNVDVSVPQVWGMLRSGTCNRVVIIARNQGSTAVHVWPRRKSWQSISVAIFRVSAHPGARFGGCSSFSPPAHGSTPPLRRFRYVSLSSVLVLG